MSQKYKLVQDNERDGVLASVRRHVGVAVWLVIVPVVTVLVLIGVSAYGEIASGNVPQRDQNQASFALTFEAIKAAATNTPQP